MTTFKKASLAASVLAASMMASAGANALAFDQNVTPDIIFGDGNTNGGFTVGQASGIEVGLRGKLRFDASGQPQDIFNSNNDGTYTFNAGVAPTQSSPTAEWSFDWSVNVDYLQDTNDSTGAVLNDFTYLLELDTDPSSNSSFTAFDPITPSSTVPFWDHAIGTNATGNGDGEVATDAATYTTLLGANNIAQNSWRPNWFFGPGFDPTLNGDYEIRLSVFATTDGGNGTVDVGGEQVAPALALAQSSIRILVEGGETPPNGDVPVPGTLALFGLGLLGTAATRRRLRRLA